MSERIFRSYLRAYVPGKKLYEELLMNEEGLKETANKMIFIGKPIEFDEEVFHGQLVELEREAMDENSDIRAAVEKTRDHLSPDTGVARRENTYDHSNAEAHPHLYPDKESH